jgi:hypothetical protein
MYDEFASKLNSHVHRLEEKLNAKFINQECTQERERQRQQ